MSQRCEKSHGRHTEPVEYMIKIYVRYSRYHCAWIVGVRTGAYEQLIPCTTDYRSREKLPLIIQQLMAVVDLMPDGAIYLKGVGGCTLEKDVYAIEVDAPTYKEIINELS